MHKEGGGLSQASRYSLGYAGRAGSGFAGEGSLNFLGPTSMVDACSSNCLEEKGLEF